MTTATKVLAALNLLGVAVALSLLATTFFAEGLIVRKAREFALDKTRIHLESAISTAEKLLQNPLVAEKLPASVKEKLNSEISDYRESPEQWLLEIAEGTGDRAGEFEFPEVKNPLARMAVDSISKRIAGAPEHFKRSLANLIRDLRIFATTHAVVFAIAAGLCFIARTPKWRFWLGIWSCLLLVTTLMCAAMYLDQSQFQWLWKILTNRYQGWAYAGTHLAITVYFALKILPEIRYREPEDASRLGTPP